MKKVLLIGPFPPLYSYGGPTKSIYGLYKTLKANNIKCKVLSPAKDLINKKNKINISNENIIYSSNFYFSFIHLLKSYRIIWFNSFFEFKLIFILILKIFLKFKLIVSPRGQLSKSAIHTSNPFIKRLFIKFIFLWKKSIYFHSTSKDETSDIKNYFPECKITQITNIFYSEFKENKSIDKKFIFYSRIHKKKGLDLLLDVLVKEKMNINLDIFGFKEDIRYWNECEKKIRLLKNVNYCGYLESGDISQLKNKYTFFLLPTHNENFGHVIIELISIGIIPLLSKKTTPYDEIIESKVGLNFQINNSNEIKAIILKALNLSDKEVIEKKTSVKEIFHTINSNQQIVKEDYINFIMSI